MRLKAGDISLIRFPRADLEAGKYRPVLLLAKMPGPFSDWLICAITSQLKHEVKNWDEKIGIKDEDFTISGLRVPSLARIGKLATVEEEIFEGALGKVSSQRLKRILKKLGKYFEKNAAED
jgi:mRNA interferase MazF